MTEWFRPAPTSLTAVARIDLPCTGCSSKLRIMLAEPKFILLPLFLVIVAGCGPSESGPSSSLREIAPYSGNYPIRAVATTGMVADLVRNIGGDRVAVTQLMSAGVDPHLYKASPGDVAALDSADIIFYSGLHLEGKMTDVFVRMARRKPTFAVTESVPEGRVLETTDGAFDPHLWFDVKLWSDAAEAVVEALITFDPPHADEYRQRADTYRQELVDLDEYARAQLATIPKSQRVLVTAHDAFRYFGRAYDVEVRGIQGISTESEAGVREVNELVKFLVDRKIKAVFVESSVSDKNVRALIEGCAANRHTVVVGGELFSDAMGDAGTPEGTYPGMLRHNVDTIVKALK